MKKLAALVAVAGLASSFTAAAGTFTLTNATSSEISEIYISSSGSDEWEENIIEGDVLPGGTQIKVTVPNYNQFDLMIRSSDGGEEDYRGFPGNVSSITLNGSGSSSYQ